MMEQERDKDKEGDIKKTETDAEKKRMTVTKKQTKKQNLLFGLCSLLNCLALVSLDSQPFLGVFLLKSFKIFHLLLCGLQKAFILQEQKLIIDFFHYFLISLSFSVSVSVSPCLSLSLSLSQKNLPVSENQ